MKQISSPSNRLSEDLHARSVARVGPSGMHNAIGARGDLCVVTEESATWEAYTGVEGGRADRLLCRECFSTVSGFTNKILDLG